MSHELRTPLNSLLILAKLLADNSEGNLTEKQIEFSRTIYSAGNDLLELINDILDLSKVEAGKMEVNLADVPLASVAERVEQTFSALARAEGARVRVLESPPGRRPTIRTDEQRLHQVLKNLLSNAFKFTGRGLGRGSSIGDGRRDGRVAFAVSDTGIGIAHDKLRLIFEAFQQADGTTSRRYGGTGLGLSISREIARLLGGEITVRARSRRGQHVHALPAARRAGAARRSSDELAAASARAVARAGGRRTADARRARRRAGGELDPALLLPGEVEDDRDDDPGGRPRRPDRRGRRRLRPHRARDGARARLQGPRRAARRHRPRARARVPARRDRPRPEPAGAGRLDGARPAEAASRRRATSRCTSSRRPRTAADALRAGAVAVFEKPVVEGAARRGLRRHRDVHRARGRATCSSSRTTRPSGMAIVELVGGGDDVEVTAVGSSEEALAALDEKRFDCMVLDLKLPKMSGFNLLEKVKEDARFRGLPVIVYTGRELNRNEERRLKKYAEAIVVKDVRSPERLLDETALFLHRVESKLPEEKRRMLEQLHSRRRRLRRASKVLVADDDVRNTFALAAVLEEHGMQRRLRRERPRGDRAARRRTPDVDLVLMDIMMPEIDGYEAMKQIRAHRRGSRSCRSSR